MTFEELYERILKTHKIPDKNEYDPYHLDCLLHPEKHAVVVKNEPCDDVKCGKPCIKSCIFDCVNNFNFLHKDKKVCISRV